MSGYGVQEANIIFVHEVTSYGYFIIFIKDALGDTRYYDRFHMLNIVTDCFVLKMWITGSTDVIRNPYIFSQNWDLL